MPNAFNIKPSENVSVLAVGIPGCGKSSAIASFASKEFPGYYFDIDHRISGIGGAREWLGEDTMRAIDYDQYDTNDGFIVIEKELIGMAQAYDKAVKDRENLPYKTIVFESITSMIEMLLIDTQRLQGIVLNQAGQLAKKEGHKVYGNIIIPSPNDYRLVKTAFRQIYYNWFQHFTKCNMFLSAWTTDKWGPPKDNPYGDKIITGRQILASGTLATEIAGYFNNVWEFDKEIGATGKLKYTVTFRSEVAKTDIPQLPDSWNITNKNFKKEFDVLVSRTKEENDKSK